MNKRLFSFTFLCLLAVATCANAALIVGEIAFFGTWQALDADDKVTTDLSSATTIDILNDTATAFVASGDFSGDMGTVAFNDIEFDPFSSITPLWGPTNNGFEFDLLSLTVVQQSNVFLSLSGLGVVRDTNGQFEDTFGAWSWSGNAPTSEATFTFTSGVITPEPATIVVWSILGLVGVVGVIKRRLVA